MNIDQDTLEAVADLVREQLEGRDQRIAALHEQLEAVQSGATELSAALEAATARVAELEGRDVATPRDELTDMIAGAVNAGIEAVRLDLASSHRAAVAELGELRAQAERAIELDAASIERLQPADGRSFLAGEYSRHLGSLYRAKSNTTATPETDPGAWQLVAAGIDTVEAQIEDGELVIVASIGGSPTELTRTRIPWYVGTFDPDRTHYRQQITTHHGASWICEAPETVQTPGEDGSPWRMIAARGKPGRAREARQ